MLVVVVLVCYCTALICLCSCAFCSIATPSPVPPLLPPPPPPLHPPAPQATRPPSQVVFGGIDRRKEALDDLAVLQCEQESWFAPEKAAVGPAARAFHAATCIGRQMFLFGGHVYVKQQHKLHQFNDLWCLNTVGAGAAAGSGTGFGLSRSICGLARLPPPIRPP